MIPCHRTVTQPILNPSHMAEVARVRDALEPALRDAFILAVSRGSIVTEAALQRIVAKALSEVSP